MMDSPQTRLDTGMNKANNAAELFKEYKFVSAKNLYTEAIQFLDYAQKYEYSQDIHPELNSKIIEKIRILKLMIEKCDKAIEDHKDDPNNQHNINHNNVNNNSNNNIGGKNNTSSTSNQTIKDSKDPEVELLREKLKSLVVMEKPNVSFEKIAGLKGVKSLLMESIELPQRFPNLFRNVRKRWKGILFFGPPGTGKSFIAKAIATEVKCSAFYSITSASIMSKYVGESQKIVKELFSLAKQESNPDNPAVIFFDEIDSFTGSRDDPNSNSGSSAALNELLAQMQGFGSDDNNIIVLAATNLPEKLDSAIRRRFEKRIYIPLPDKDARVAMFKMYMGKFNIDHILSDQDFEELGRVSDGYSGADLEIVCRDALMTPLRISAASSHFKKVLMKDQGEMFVACQASDANALKMSIKDIPKDKLILKPVRKSIVMESLHKTKPSVSKDQLKKFEKYQEEFGYLT